MVSQTNHSRKERTKEKKINFNDWDEKQLRSLKHNDFRTAFFKYLNSAYDSKAKRDFLLSWINPKKEDVVLECGSASGTTGIHLTKNSGCYVLGIDFDSKAIKISTRMRNKFFPELKSKCCFRTGNLETMRFPTNVTKVVMADFTEHIPDRVFNRILDNLKKQFPHVLLYIYTPSRTHIFEILKRNNFILKELEGHINVKTEKELKNFLELRRWRILKSGWKPSYIPWFKNVEFLMGFLPFLGSLFHRRIILITTPDASNKG